MMIVKAAIVRLLLSLIFYDYATGLIIPEELPTILSLIYSNIPPIKKGTDSRFGVGFRLGEHADFQVVVELGPQSETDPIGTNEVKRRRDAMFNAAMKGDLGPLAQAVAKYQMEQRIVREMDKLKAVESELEKIRKENESEDTLPNNWLTRWKEEMSQPLKENVPLTSDQNKDNKVIQKIEKSARPNIPKDKLEELVKLYERQSKNTRKETPAQIRHQHES